MRSKANPIAKLRNRFWLILSSSFIAIFLFSLVAVYMSYSLSAYQQIQTMHYNRSYERYKFQRLFLDGPRYFEMIISETDVQRISGEWELYYSWIAPFELTEAEVLELVEMARAPSRIRDRLLWNIPMPFVEFQNRTWIYHFENWSWDFGFMFDDPDFQHPVQSLEIIATRDPTHIMFTDVTWNLSGLPIMRRNLMLIGVVGNVFFLGFSYFLSSALTKPSLRAFERQKQFIADASHELKTPLQIIRSNYAIVLDNESETVASQKKWLANMEFGFQRLSHLTADLLTLASLENGVHQEILDWGETCQTILQSLKIPMEEKQLSLIYDLEAGVKICQNQEKLTQLMVILLDNAIKYTPTGGQITVTLSRHQKLARLSVKNTGPGLEDSQLKKIFERFYRADASRNSQSGSYGLGLAIAKGIVEQGGGKIWATSAPGEETTFMVSFKLS